MSLHPFRSHTYFEYHCFLVKIFISPVPELFGTLRRRFPYIALFRIAEHKNIRSCDTATVWTQWQGIFCSHRFIVHIDIKTIDIPYLSLTGHAALKRVNTSVCLVQVTLRKTCFEKKSIYIARNHKIVPLLLAKFQ